jgi:hypothetical protein
MRGQPGTPERLEGSERRKGYDNGYVYRLIILLTFIPASEGEGGGFGMGKLFADPNLLGKLAANPRTMKHLADPAFLNKVTFSPQS